jgi:hypothetical protein
MDDQTNRLVALGNKIAECLSLDRPYQQISGSPSGICREMHAELRPTIDGVAYEISISIKQAATMTPEAAQARLDELSQNATWRENALFEPDSAEAKQFGDLQRIIARGAHRFLLIR